MNIVFYKKVHESTESLLKALLQQTRNMSAVVFLGTITLIVLAKDPKSPPEESLDLGPQ